jgi:hypothetical protein
MPNHRLATCGRVRWERDGGGTFGEAVVVDLVSRDIGTVTRSVIAFVSVMINTVKLLREE